MDAWLSSLQRCAFYALPFCWEGLDPLLTTQSTPQ
ncbi:Protein CBG27653 [Caenorhabditis briggsae]|uniref:Protein CBG27653 n=1 Tax=Caenorhabditis briggsae TaxID=6238 RepID=B6IJ98_CAEBR|nr:Protein CBG27653 [Caenorhabditis briggsae]CAR99932.1 Protein CBG27653 [Caenorhabditis briggsae]